MPRRRAGETARKMAFAGMACALVVACVIIASLFPSMRMSVLSVGLLVTMASAATGGRRFGWSVYAASAVLALLLAPDKLMAAMYVAFFGLYPLLKYEIESRCRWTWLAVILKLIYLNAALSAAYFFARALLGDWLPIPLIWIAAQPLFLILDVIASRLLAYYQRRFPRR